jgi:catechol 1,2-dioxygenase
MNSNGTIDGTERPATGNASFAAAATAAEHGIIAGPDSVTPIVLRAMAGGEARLNELMTALVRHVHAFIEETRLTEDEYQGGLGFLAAIGHATGPTKNEAVLLGDILGVSTLVTLQNNAREESATASAVLGPFWRKNAPRMAAGGNIARGDTPGVPLEVSGRVTDAAGKPLAGVDVDVWQASPVGFYENQDPRQPPMNLRGVFTTNGDGRYHFKTVRPAGYPVPTDGPCGDLLRAQKRHPYRPAHLHFMLSAPGYRTLVTQVFADDAEGLNRDVVFAVLRSLVGRFEETTNANGEPEARLNYDFVMEPGEQSFPIPPIP